MDCEACTAHTNGELSKVNGVIEANTSYINANAIVKFYNTKTSVDSLAGIVNNIEYKVISSDSSTNKMDTNIILQSIITCPNCGHQKEETMPTDACRFFYECRNCKTRLKPKQGDCCVYCSYGTVVCPPKQGGNSCF